MNDPYDSGTPKYSTAQDIYDALNEMSSGEEIGILSNMFPDVSWEGQDYYYTDNAGKLVEKWETVTDYGDKMWIMDVALWQLSDGDANDWIFEILCNADLAKRIGFKKLFVDNVLGGMSGRYESVAEAYEEELHELNRFGFYENTKALAAALTANGYNIIYNPYGKLCTAVYNKLKGMRLDAEKQLVAESRAMLTGYDDFMFGLRMNQQLYTTLEQQYSDKVARLQASYKEAVQKLMALAREQGVVFEISEAGNMLLQAGKGNTDV